MPSCVICVATGETTTTFDPCGVVPCVNNTPCMQTAPANTTQGQAQNANNGGGSGSVSQWTSALSSLGVSVASIVTGRPVVTTTVNGQKIASLGQKPLVTGQVTASSVLLFGVIAAIAVAFIVVNKQ